MSTTLAASFLSTFRSISFIRPPQCCWGELSRPFILTNLAPVCTPSNLKIVCFMADLSCLIQATDIISKLLFWGHLLCALQSYSLITRKLHSILSLGRDKTLIIALKPHQLLSKLLLLVQLSQTLPLVMVFCTITKYHASTPLATYFSKKFYKYSQKNNYQRFLKHCYH